MDSIGKIKPYMFSFLKRGQASSSRLVSLYFWGGLEMWSGHFDFLIFVVLFVFICVLFFFFNRLASSSSTETTALGTSYLPGLAVERIWEGAV